MLTGALNFLPPCKPSNHQQITQTKKRKEFQHSDEERQVWGSTAQLIFNAQGSSPETIISSSFSDYWLNVCCWSYRCRRPTSMTKRVIKLIFRGFFASADEWRCNSSTSSSAAINRVTTQFTENCEFCCHSSYGMQFRTDRAILTFPACATTSPREFISEAVLLHVQVRVLLTYLVLELETPITKFNQISSQFTESTKENVFVFVQVACVYFCLHTTRQHDYVKLVTTFCNEFST